MRSAAMTGFGLMVLYTLLITCGDAVVKDLSAAHSAPQVFSLSALVVVSLTLVFGLRSGTAEAGAGSVLARLGTSCPRAMALRSAATVLAAIGYFYAFRLLHFAEVFVFIGLTPVFAALLSGPVLGERPGNVAIGALAAGVLGILCLFPTGQVVLSAGHVAAFLATFMGAVSMVLCRYIGRRESNAMAQVLYPNLAILVVMGAALPLNWRPLAPADAGLIVLYGVLLFAGRWLLVQALRLLPAYTVTSLVKLQFVWMVLIGALVFDEWPALNVYAGAALVIASGLILVFAEKLPFPPAAARARPTPTTG